MAYARPGYSVIDQTDIEPFLPETHYDMWASAMLVFEARDRVWEHYTLAQAHASVFI